MKNQTKQWNALVASMTSGAFTTSKPPLPATTPTARELAKAARLPIGYCTYVTHYAEDGGVGVVPFPLLNTPIAREFRRMISGALRFRNSDRYRIVCATGPQRDHYNDGRNYEVTNRRNLADRNPYPQTFLEKVASLSLTPETFKYERAVGIELETYAPLSRDEAAAILPYWARRTDDGSLTAPRDNTCHEIRALLTRSEMEPRLFRLCRILYQFKINKSCGFHVHFDMRGRSLEEVRKKAIRADKWIAALIELLPQSRRDNNFAKPGISTSDRYRRVNLCAFGKYKTLEIRAHSGTVDYTKILAWIRLCELILAVHQNPKPQLSCVSNLELLPLAEHDLAYWKTRHKDLNPHLYNNHTTTNTSDGSE